MELPETTKDITVVWLNQALHENGFLGSANIVSLKQEQIGVGRGFLSDMAKLTLVFDQDAPYLPNTVIAKLPPSRQAARELVMGRNLFEREIRFYIEVAPTSPLRTPRFIYSAMSPEKQRYVLLMEDCSYATPADPGGHGLTYEQTKIVVSKIADFHARWWNDENLRAFPWLPKLKNSVAAMVNGTDALWDAYDQSVEFKKALPEGGWEAGLKIRDQFRWLAESMPDDKLTLIHFDLRNDNMFFDWRTPDNPLIALDWAAACIGRCATDLSWLLGGFLATELRRQVEKDMVKLYHEHLLGKGISEYTLSECWTDYLRGLLLKTRIVMAAARLALSDPRGLNAVTNINVYRWFSAIVDNEATSILP